MTITTFKILCDQQGFFAHEVLNLFFECEKLNIDSDETITLLDEYLYPVYEKNRTPADWEK